VRTSIGGNFGAGSSNWANIFHCQLTTSSSIAQADLDTWTTSFQAAFKTNFAPVQGNVVAYVLAKTILYTPGGGELISSIAMTGTGSQAGTNQDVLSPCKIISWLSTVYWRGGKPRTYLPGVMTVDSTDSRNLTSTAMTNAKNAAVAFRTAVNALTSGTITGTTLGFVSFFTGNVLRSPPVFFPITGATVHPRMGTQRRRLGRWTT